MRTNKKNKRFKKPIPKNRNSKFNKPFVSVLQSGRKRGRPRKQQRPQIIEISSNGQYNYAQEQNLKAHLKKVKQIFKIRTRKCLMSLMYQIRTYMQASWKFGQLDLPFAPTSQQIERGLKQMLKDI